VASVQAGSKGWRSTRRPVSPVTPARTVEDVRRERATGRLAVAMSRRISGSASKRRAGTGSSVSDGFGSNARAGTPATRASSRRVRQKRKPARARSSRQVREEARAGMTQRSKRDRPKEDGASGHMRTRAWPANAEGDENLKRGARHSREPSSRCTLCTGEERAGSGRSCVRTRKTGPARSALAGRLIRLPAGRSRANETPKRR